jgi:hypothetical protein
MSEHDRSVEAARQERATELAARRDADIEAHKTAHDAQIEAQGEAEFQDAGYDETIPGQVEVVAGTPEHERELKAFPNASSYGPHVKVVVAPNPEPEEPEVLEPEVPPDAPATQPSRY